MGRPGNTPAASTYFRPGRRSKFILEMPSHLLMNGSASRSQVVLSSRLGSGKRWQLWQTRCAKVAPCSISDGRTIGFGGSGLFGAARLLTEFVAEERTS